MLDPLYDRVLVKVEPKPKKTASGLHLPGSDNKNAPKKGTVICFGEGHLLQDGQIRPLLVEEGDTVLFKGMVGTEIEVEDQEGEFVILRESELLARFK
jgi:chaperonin GroES